MILIKLIEILQEMREHGHADVMFSSSDVGWEPVEVVNIEHGRVILSMD